MKRTTENWLAGGLIGAYLIYVALRAWLLPITHDEGATIINHVPRLVIDTLTYQKEANPNNHILNTLAIKTLLGIFSGSQLIVRLPVLIGCSLYLWSGWNICRRLFSSVWLRLFGLVLLLGNPFLAEFFGLARGYGLAIGLMTSALYQAVRFFENNQPKTLRGALLFAGLAVYANFTLLLFFIPFSALLLFAAWQKNRAWPAFWSVARPGIYTIGIYAALWYLPLAHLSQDWEITNWARLASNFETVKLLIHSSVHGNLYLGYQTTLILSWLTLAGIIGSWIFGIWQWRAENWRLVQDPKVFFPAILAGAIMVYLAQIYFLDTAQLNARLSLFLYPLFALSLASVAGWVWNRWGQRSWVLMAPVLLILLINNVRCLNLKSSFEWWFDANTFDVLHKIQAIQNKEGRKEPYILDCNWIYQNSFATHILQFSQGYDQAAKMVPWHPDRVPETGPDFFYLINDGEINALNGGYEMVAKFPSGSLLRKK